MDKGGIVMNGYGVFDAECNFYVGKQLKVRELKKKKKVISF